MQNILMRQLRRTMGIADDDQLQQVLAELASLAGSAAVSPQATTALKGLGGLLERVNGTYAQQDRDIINTRMAEDLAFYARFEKCMASSGLPMVRGQHL